MAGEIDLQKSMKHFIHDPLGFVYFIYPWGKPGPLEDEQPEKWQIDSLIEIGDLSKEQAKSGHKLPINYAIKAGRGVGKSAFFAWIAHWFESTRPKSQGVMTANTKVQLETRTWRELAKWVQISKNSHWFVHNASKFYHKANPKLWFMTPVVWSKERPQAIAGLHEDYVMAAFDEASEIPDVIWESIEGGFTDKYVLWLVAGNPTLNTGRFKDCWGEFAHRWHTKTVDSRECRRTNKAQIQNWLEDYGEDNDFFKVWVKGEFPNASVRQYFPEDLINEAVNRIIKESTGYPILMGEDVARDGNSRNVITVRQGYSIPYLYRIPGKIENIMEMVGITASKIVEWNPNHVFIDSGYGFAIIDRLRQLGHRNIFEVKFGARANQETRYVNKRAEMYALFKQWLMEGGSLPNDPLLIAGLLAIMAGEDKKGRLQLVSKKDMPDGISLDEADSIVTTFAYPVKFDYQLDINQAQTIMDIVEGRKRQNVASYLR